MKKFFNKYIVIILSIYAFWILGLPFIFAKTLPFLCKNFNKHAKYKIELLNPKLRLNIIPNAVITADKLEIKGADDYISIIEPDLKTSLRYISHRVVGS